MNKNFIKMNNNTNQLSLGNLIQIIKKYSVNKHLANQAYLFCLIFNIEDVNESTVNNYCIGARSISDDYKNIYLDLQKKYLKDKSIFVPIIGKIAGIIIGQLDNTQTIEELNNNKYLKKICLTLYNISKNDKSVEDDFSTKLYKLINDNNIYECLSELLIFVILEHRQPIYINEKIKEKLENILYNTNISLESLQEFISMHFDDGINYDYTVRQLAKKNNPYALFELGLSEYSGKMMGYPRYNIAFEYFEKAASFNHPKANYIAGRMLIEGNVGNCSEIDIKKGLQYLNKAEQLNNIACLNTLGQFYLKNNDENKAIKYFEKAAIHNFVYAFNNLGKIYEKKKQYAKAFEYYLKSANLEESWACNKVGEMYRLGIGTNIDLKKAFEYYNKALNVEIEFVDNYAKYNLAVYFYMYGNYEINLEKDESKALQLLEESSKKIIDSQIFLLCYYVSKNDLDNIYKYKEIIENNPKFDLKLKKHIEEIIKKIKNNNMLKIEL